jgi:hypothetical protein
VYTNQIRIFFISCILTLSLKAEEAGPWVGELFQGLLEIKGMHTESHSLDTSRGVVKKKLHNDATSASLGFTPSPNEDIGLELNLAATQKYSYGFDSIQARYSYFWLDDLQNDPISFATRYKVSATTARRARDVSSKNHAPLEMAFAALVGKEFVFTQDSFIQAWFDAGIGIGSTGSPWLKGDFHLGYTYERHRLSLFYSVEKCLSNGVLSHTDTFRSWSHVGYQYTEVGASYRFKDVGYGLVYFQVSKRIQAHMCQRNSTTVMLGIVLPLNIFDV